MSCMRFASVPTHVYVSMCIPQYRPMYINQSNFYSANIPGVVWFSGATAISVFKYQVIEAIP